MVSLAPGHNPNKDFEVANAPGDSVSSLAWSPTANYLVAGSWDNMVRCWEVLQNGQAVPKAVIEHQQPVLDVTWNHDGSQVFSASCDQTVKAWDISSGQSGVVAQHDAPIKSCHWVADTQMLVTGSWDKTMRYWDTRTPAAQLTVQLPERVYCSDVNFPLAVVGTAERLVVVYDLRNPQREYKRMQSPLKFQSRCVTCFPDKSGFALGSIEGRVAVQYVEDRNANRNFAFKCHRDNNEIYAVNSIKFHPFGTFATTGSDGAFNFWDKDSKQRLRAFNRCNAPIPCSAFNADGTIFAYAVSYDWHKGCQHHNLAQKNYILLHHTPETEIKPRSGKAKGRK